MRAERKHELQHNELEDLLQKAGSFLRQHGAMLAIVAAVVLLAILTYYLVLAPRSMNAPAGKWNDYFYALSDRDSAEELDSFIDGQKNASDPPVMWARIALADKQLAKASQQLFEDRKAAETSLESAEQNYLEVEKTPGAPAELRNRARIGLAEVYESRNKPDDAIKYYEMVLKTSPDSPYGKLAARGHKRLSEESNRDFLAWFAKQEPIKRSTRPGATPFGLPGLPETPDFTVPPTSPGGISRGTIPPDESDRPITPGLKLPPASPEGLQDPPPLDAPQDEPGEPKDAAEPKEEPAPAENVPE